MSVIQGLQQHQMVTMGGDTVAREIRDRTSLFGGKVDTYIAGGATEHRDPAGPTLAVRQNWNATRFRTEFGRERSYGVQVEAVGSWPGMRAIVRMTGLTTSDLVVHDSNHKVAAVIQLGVDAPSGPLEGPLTSVAYQKSLDARSGFLTLNGHDTFEVGDGTLTPLTPTGSEWWARDRRAFLRQDG